MKFFMLYCRVGCSAVILSLLVFFICLRKDEGKCFGLDFLGDSPCKDVKDF